MFTGIVQGLGFVRSLPAGGIEIELPGAMHDRIGIGESVAVNGACLTARGPIGQSFRADLSRQTQSGTTLGALRIGTRVNLELPLRPSDRLGGHLVLGHVDAVGRIQALYRDGNDSTLIVSYPTAFCRYVVEKGSVAVDGISLTAYGLDENTFRCAIVPETYARTTLQDRRGGDPLNLEFDILAKYVERMMGHVHHD